eukprot:m.223476 g.223476  ORF g.223476 m.223476 type:complete len:228 (+) comp26345_c0_seq5:81-764(+)
MGGKREWVFPQTNTHMRTYTHTHISNTFQCDEGGCHRFKNKDTCVDHCPDGTFAASDSTCQPCDPKCTERGCLDAPDQCFVEKPDRPTTTPSTAPSSATTAVDNHETHKSQATTPASVQSTPAPEHSANSGSTTTTPMNTTVIVLTVVLVLVLVVAAFLVGRRMVHHESRPFQVEYTKVLTDDDDHLPVLGNVQPQGDDFSDIPLHTLKEKEERGREERGELKKTPL